MVQGEGPCSSDEDCSVTHASSCCGCRSLAVLSKKHKSEKPPACGCADQSMEQMKALITGEPGPCGFPPPPTEDYRAECRAMICVGVHR